MHSIFLFTFRFLIALQVDWGFTIQSMVEAQALVCGVGLMASFIRVHSRWHLWGQKLTLV